MELLIIFFISVCASFIGAQVGSGGTILIPFLIFFGLPAPSAIAAHKTASLFGDIAALRKYAQDNMVKWRLGFSLASLEIVGSAIGASLLLSIDPEFVARTLGFVILIPIPFLFISNVGLKNQKRSKLTLGIGSAIYFLLTIWSGVFHAGALTLFIYLLATFFGLTFIQAKATKIIPSYFGRITAIIIYIYGGIMNWTFIIPITIGYMIGSHLGASFALTKGNRWVRALLVIVVSASSVKLILF
ncbi:TSUP family transporter [Patescibacteria group bacterium]|nr:TSUP family transporter [Patescibacteria group bacterium]